MKKLIIVALALIVIRVNAQKPWIDRMPIEDRNNFSKIQESFKEYTKSLPGKEASAQKRKSEIQKMERSGNKHYENKGFAEYEVPGLFQYKRWEWLNKNRLDANGNLPDAKLMKQIKLEQMYSKQFGKTTRNLLPKWNNLNPANFLAIGGAGRINSVRIHPTDPNLLYACAAGGGLWKSINGGTSWTSLGDDFASTGTGDVGLSARDQNLVFVGTGDGRSSDAYSIGILKSVNGGQSFDTTGLEFNVQDQFVIRQVIVNSKNNKIVYALSGSGFYRSIDGGVKFTYIASAGNARDMVVNPVNPNTIFLTTSGGIKRSINAGQSWTIVSSFPYNNLVMGRLAICNTPHDTNYMYVLVGNAANQGGNSVYKTINYGVSWTKVYDMNVTKNLLAWDVNGLDFNQGQAFYSFEIGVSTTDKNKVFVGGVNVWRSTNGGTTFSCIAHWYGANGLPYVHADIHSFEFLPSNGNIMYVGCDGGVFKTINGGSTFTALNNGLHIQQYYKIGLAKTDSTLISVGSQDNGSAAYDAAIWRETTGGDGMETFIDKANPDIMFTSLYYGDIFQSTDRGYNFTNVSPPVAGNWVTPYVADPNAANTFYIGTDKIYKTTNNGNSYTSISNSVSLGGSLYDFIAVAPSNSNYIYTIVNGTLRKTTNGGTTWSAPLYSGSFPSMVSLAISNVNPNLIWCTFDGYVTTTSRVLKSTNGGVSFTNISNNLSNVIPVNTIVHIPNSNNTLFVGTDFGVKMFKDGFTGWVDYENGLPNVKITELEYHAASNRLVAGTYGRGLWDVKLPAVNVKPDDAALSSVTNTSRLVCNNQVSPRVVLYNNGADTLKNVTITYGLKGQTLTNFNWTGNLKSSNQVTVVLPPFTASASGDFLVQAYVQNPNGNTDYNTFNDSVTTLITIEGVALSTPFIEGFEGATFPPTGWTINNPDNFKTWEQDIYVGNASAQSAALKNAVYTQGYKQRDELVTPLIQANAGDSLALKFDYAYAYWTTPKKFSDSLTIMASTNCGLTYQVIYKAWGDSLATAPPLQSPFAPQSANDWKTRLINLTNINTTGTLLIKFINSSDWENNLYLDNIQIGQFNLLTKNTEKAISSNSIVIQPNPTSNQFVLQVANNEGVHYEIYNALGQLVKKDKLSNTQNSIDVSQFAKGLHIVKVYQNDILFAIEKLIIE